MYTLDPRFLLYPCLY